MRKLFLITSTVLLLAALSGCGPEYCEVSGCPSEAASGSDYCYSHKCLNFSCSNKGSLMGKRSYCTECLDRASE